MSKIKKIVIHCSDSAFGNALLIDQWHKQRGWSGIGYHRVVLNGYPEDSKNYWNHLDGDISPGRPLDTDFHLKNNEIGAHAYGFNRESVGICLIGKPGLFSPRQLASTKALAKEFLRKFDLPISAVVGHYELDSRKTCPGWDMDVFRAYLDTYINPPFGERLERGLLNALRI